jgi:hypothetical protein
VEWLWSTFLGYSEFPSCLRFFLLADDVAWICRFFPSCGEFFKLAVMRGSQKTTKKPGRFSLS